MRIMLLFNIFFLIVTWPIPGLAGDSRCADRIISIGDTVSELLMRCGEADWKQFHTEEIIAAADSDNKQKIIIPVEEWTYDAGPDRFMRIFTLRGGRVAEIRTGDYGSPKEQDLQPPCGDRVISVGDTAAEVMAKCGEPFRQDRREEVVSRRIDDGTVLKVSVTVEEWTYDFGPNRFLRIFSFRNGTITNIRTGGYGSEDTY
jgi:hypothetical protein